MENAWRYWVMSDRNGNEQVCAMCVSRERAEAWIAEHKDREPWPLYVVEKR